MRFHFFHDWSDWGDVLVFNAPYDSHLLQARKCLDCGAAQFRTAAAAARWPGMTRCGTLTEEKLRAVNIWDDFVMEKEAP